MSEPIPDPTTFDPFVSTAPLIVYVDIKSPYAFVAKDPTRRLAEGLGVDVDWRPLTLDIPSYLGSARLDDKGKVAEANRTPSQWNSVRYAYRDARRYASLRGLTLRGTVKIWDTSLVHIGMIWVKQQGDAALARYLDLVYEGFWKREFDAEDAMVVADAVAEAGGAPSGFPEFLDGPGRETHDAMQAAIFDAGIFGVPSYLVDGELFFGRENLPMVRWLLSGRSGPAPDVAYCRF
ncbi:MAG: DsbA family protein [Gammaproteobacteria bacterium]|nr:DsbA family protein [Gammaproteobacteria bacterium]